MNQGEHQSSRTHTPSPYGTPVQGSMRVSTQLIEPVLRQPRRLRNVCILAHVDHGKTTLTDTLLASNGIISFRLAGKLRYMDSREDEQQRGITMQASAITLLYDRIVEGGNSERHAVNLIDSPGHVDFSRQVVTATRLCDGCLILVDAVEGMCTQTMSVLRQAKREQLTPILVINKLDKLVVDLRMTTYDAAEWLFQLVEQMNALYSTLKMGDSDDLTSGSDVRECDGESNVFDPIKGNVVFASSTEGWAFTLEKFAKLLSVRLRVPCADLLRGLWGHFVYDKSTNKVVSYGSRVAEAHNRKKCMFAAFVLDSVWAVYESTSFAFDEQRIQKICDMTGSKVSSRELRAKDGGAIRKRILGQWLPLADTVFSSIIAHIQDPVEASKSRLAALSSHSHINTFAPGIAADGLSVAFISKLFSVSMMVVHRHTSSDKTNMGSSEGNSDASVDQITAAMFALDAHPSERMERIFGMARLFCGTIRKGQTMYLIKPRKLSMLIPGCDEDTALEKDGTSSVGTRTEQCETFCPVHELAQQITDACASNDKPILYPNHEAHPFVLDELYLLMGRDLEPVEEVNTGCIFGVGGSVVNLFSANTKWATIASSPDCEPIIAPHSEITPIVCVAVRPKRLEDMQYLLEGLDLLCRVDPCAETYLQPENGENILATAGELHLEQCLKDLRERYIPCAPSALHRASATPVELVVSPPMVPYRETINKEKIKNTCEDGWRDVLAAYGCSQNGFCSNTMLTNDCREQCGDGSGASTTAINQNDASHCDDEKARKCYSDAECIGVDDTDTCSKTLSVNTPECDYRASDGLLNVCTIDGKWRISAKAVPMPAELIKVLQKYTTLLPEGLLSDGPVERALAADLSELLPNLSEPWRSWGVRAFWGIGPRYDLYSVNAVLCTLPSVGESLFFSVDPSVRLGASAVWTAFELAISKGPMAHEPIHGVAYVVERLDRVAEEGESAAELGGLITTCRALFDGVFSFWSPRLMLAMYRCSIQTSSEMMGRVYAALSKRRGQVINDEYHEGTQFFTIHALLPVEESFGFSDDLRGRTSGIAIPQLLFSGFELLDQDPYWMPLTEDEIDEHGDHDTSLADNVAMRYLVRIRERKGLFVERKVVQFAEKQRTLRR